MSDNFRAAGVPWFAAANTPAIRPREIPPLSQEKVDWKVAKMHAAQYVRDAIRAKWKSGDRFYITTAFKTRYNFTNKRSETEQCQHAGQTGIFLEIKLAGYTYFALVKWDDPTYKPVGLGNRLSVYDLYHFGFTWEEAASFVEPIAPEE